MQPNFDLEEKYISLGYNFIAGVDEVGRGSLAGPLLAGAVILERNKLQKLNGVKDSKKLSSRQRCQMCQIIKSEVYDYATGRVEVAEIEQIGISAANILAFSRALDNLKKVDFALIDGRDFRGFGYPYQCVVKGDSQSISIAAASIIAKVERDELMAQLEGADIYGFDRHAGYGTAKHIAAIKKYGPGLHHRRSFLGKILTV